MNYSEEFEKNKIVVINKFIDPILAEQIFFYLNFKKPPQTWTASICFDNVKSDIQAKESNQEQINKNIKKANKAYENDKFSFSFQRTLNNHTNCNCFECSIKNIFKIPDIINQIRQITNINITTAHDIFISKYSYNNFLSIHSDKNNGRIAFILNLTKDWKPQYGGLLHILNNERSEVIKTIVPLFNTLTLFYIPENIGIPHYVSHITIKNKNRYAITGWFS
jgi:Rps23 Pro-64 3,4-dihydroxylase Tpa1-like proline 4-hydroxylase